MTTPSGDDSPTANQVRELEGMEADTSNSHLTPLRKSDTKRVSPTRPSWQRPRDGRRKSTRTKAGVVDGRTAGGWRPVDKGPGVFVAIVVVVLFSIAVGGLVALFTSGDHERIKHRTIDGVECVVVNDGLGHPKMVDCNWKDHG